MDTIKAIAEYGVLVVIAGVFILTWVAGFKIIPAFFEKLLAHLEKMNNNFSEQNDNMKTALGSIAVSLEIIKNQTEDNTDLFKTHDKRAEDINNKLTEVCAIVRNKN